MPEPYVSVIVTAHDRRRYLPEALRSLERQTLDKEKFEVIVVKNFEDPISDSIIRRNGWKNVVTDVKPLGGKIAIGIQESRGEVITFLEDDDLYRPERLQVVERKFREVKNLVYFHNDQVVIDEDGNAVPARIASGLVFPYLLGSDLVVDERIKRIPCSLDYVRALTGADFNNSSIAVRRGLLGPRDLEALGGLPTAVDMYLYARAFVGDGAMYLTPSRLTVYRVHAGNASALVLPWVARRYLEGGTLQEFVERLRAARLARALRAIRGCLAVYELARENCGPYNLYWRCYVGGKFGLITYSRGRPPVERASLPRLLRETAIYVSLARRYDEFAARLLRASGAAGPGAKWRGVLAAALSDSLAISLYAALRYLLQFSPEAAKGRLLGLYFKLSLYRGLRSLAAT